MPSGREEHYDFFLSRRGSVAAIAREVADVLTDKGYKVLVQDYDIPLGASFIDAMHGRRGGGDREGIAADDHACLRVRRPSRLLLRELAQSHRQRGRAQAAPRSGAIYRLARAGIDLGNAAKPAHHSQSSRADADRQRVIAGNAGIWRTWNFSARGRGNTPGDVMGSLIKELLRLVRSKWRRQRDAMSPLWNFPRAATSSIVSTLAMLGMVARHPFI
jgi:hypothetical protein